MQCWRVLTLVVCPFFTKVSVPAWGWYFAIALPLDPRAGCGCPNADVDGLPNVLVPLEPKLIDEPAAWPNNDVVWPPPNPKPGDFAAPKPDVDGWPKSDVFAWVLLVWPNSEVVAGWACPNAAKRQFWSWIVCKNKTKQNQSLLKWSECLKLTSECRLSWCWLSKCRRCSCTKCRSGCLTENTCRWWRCTEKWSILLSKRWWLPECICRLTKCRLLRSLLLTKWVGSELLWPSEHGWCMCVSVCLWSSVVIKRSQWT